MNIFYHFITVITRVFFGAILLVDIVNADELAVTPAIDTLEANQSVRLCVEGGSEPYQWQLPAGLLVVDRPNNSCVTLLADRCFCSEQSVSVTDSESDRASLTLKGTGSWVEIERKSHASLITTVALPIPRTDMGTSYQWFGEVTKGSETYRVQQDWRFNDTYSSSSPSTCSSATFPPKGAPSGWAPNIAVYPRYPHQIGYSDEDYAPIYPYHPWDDADNGTFAATDNRKICGRNGHGMYIRVGTPRDNAVVVWKWICPNQEECSNPDRENNFDRPSC